MRILAVWKLLSLIGLGSARGCDPFPYTTEERRDRLGLPNEPKEDPEIEDLRGLPGMARPAIVVASSELSEMWAKRFADGGTM